MSDTGRESLTGKAKQTYDSAASAVQPESQKSTSQKAADTVKSGDTSGQSGGSLLDKAKDTLGMSGDKTSATERNV
ncbi:hypothetical protein JCM11251_002373 [Rhodosporidiobolus azoricus]